MLDPHVRVIQGDGIDFDSLTAILDGASSERGWSADNIAFGSGGGLLQKLNRDTLKFAFKCSSATVHGAERDVFKQPITDNGKRSKAGRLKLVRDRDGYRTVAARRGRRRPASSRSFAMAKFFVIGSSLKFVLAQ